ncbi:MAG: glutamate synthase large subunit [Fibrobacterota bacterium]
MNDFHPPLTANAAGVRKAVGLYNPAYEHDSCGVGLVARIDGVPCHSVIEDGLQVLINLEHRGAKGGDKRTGDGSGIMVRIPDAFFRRELAVRKIILPSAGNYAAAMIFLPSQKKLRAVCEEVFERIVIEEGGAFLGWRDMPFNESALGDLARSTQPGIRQAFMGPGNIPADRLGVKATVIRRLVEKEIASRRDGDYSQFYICSFSDRTFVYKGLFSGTQLREYYPDLSDPDFKSPFSIMHQRYSTNTMPTWHLAHPYRFVAHNGEINTLRGNINRMKAREAILASEVLGADIDKIKPVVVEGGSDSAIFDNILELLVLAGRSIPHAMFMMVPQAWGAKFHISEDVRAFFEYHSSFMEPWDGPAALVFTDGRYVGATLDRNGLRPSRYTITRDGRIILASETGVLDIPGPQVLRKGRLQPGRMLLVDLVEKRIVPDNEIKAKVCRQRPYRHWLKDNHIELRGLFTPAEIPAENPDTLLKKQLVFGYSEDELKFVLAPMASHGQEAVGSMGDDTPLAVLSDRPKSLFVYFKQLFAQVTNPPIDPLREELVMSLTTFTGRERNLLAETPEHCRRLKLPHPILTPDDMERVRRSQHPDVVARDLDIVFPLKGDGDALRRALDLVFREAVRHISEGATFLILTDRKMSGQFVPIPVLLALSGLHHFLIRQGLRTSVGLIVETGEAREIMHFALLVGYGANAVCPNTAFSTIRSMAESGQLEGAPGLNEVTDNYITAIKKGLLKTFSRMGISTLRSYCGAQIFEAVGLKREVIDAYFCDTPSRVEGIGLDEIAMQVNLRHKRAFGEPDDIRKALDFDGMYNVRTGGEKHRMSPAAIARIQKAVRTNDAGAFADYVRVIDDPEGARVTLRSLFRFKAGTPVPLKDVESATSIVKRFVASAMSFGSLSQEAHEAIALAFNRIGSRSNSGEGGEAPERAQPRPDGTSLRSRVKQVASGRFGVSTEYLVSADELQIKMAQGAKPGEGGQLPGHKVSADIARVRFTTPGVTLISPPPHHDIYSIEDLAQLIHDLKCVNPAAAISVKLVSEVGVGTVAAGVAKAKAELVLISGYDGGTGASPLTSIKYAGLPWELGLAETHQALLANGLRDRIRVQTDGQMRTGRDIAIAAMLGAEEFGFGTILLVTLGCVMLRKCHLNTCAMGVATQDPELRKNFKGKPEHVERFLMFLAEDLRGHMARLGFRTVSEMIGRSDCLEADIPHDHYKLRGLDFSALLFRSAAFTERPQYCIHPQDHELDKSLDNELLRLAAPALERGEKIRARMSIRNVDRTVGSMLSGEIVRRKGARGLPDDTIHIDFTGTAGQSLGAFLAPGVTFRIEGDANDYVGKGMSGGRIILTPPADTTFLAADSIIAGNTVLYGATGGTVFINGQAGERFAVRNSGATAVVEGVGDHGCEYMTGGTVVVLGGTGNNFAAGMSGGTAYVYDPSQLFDTRCNLDMVDLEGVWTESDRSQLQRLLEEHWKETGSRRARAILDNWETHLPLFVRVVPVDYRKSLERMAQARHRDDDTVSATEEVFNG